MFFVSFPKLLILIVVAFFCLGVPLMTLLTLLKDRRDKEEKEKLRSKDRS
jgi:hypothetical protein|tara:strand:- start:440 stop:589 length:150 start_codon:yes stop_codon:yes gene_type:complete